MFLAVSFIGKPGCRNNYLDLAVKIIDNSEIPFTNPIFLLQFARREDKAVDVAKYVVNDKGNKLVIVAPLLSVFLALCLEKYILLILCFFHQILNFDQIRKKWTCAQPVVTSD